MKIKLFFVSILITIVLIAVGIYLIISFNKGTADPVAQNDKLESTDSKGKINDSSNIKSVNPLTNEDFVLKDNNTYIELGGKYGDLITNEKIIKTVPANEKHIYDIYEFDNFKILTQPGDGTTSIIASIDLTTPTIHTSRGISVGDTTSEVIEKYGNTDDDSTADSITPSQYVYCHNGQYLTFFIDKNGRVVLIRFELV